MKAKTEKTEYMFGIGNVIAINHCLTLLSDVSQYRSWLNRFHKTRNMDRLIYGYELALNVLFGQLLSELADNISLKLSDSDVFNRAIFAGVSLSIIPNDSQKSILLKNVLTKSNYVLEANEWDELDIRLRQFHLAVGRPIEVLKSYAVLSDRLKTFGVDQIINAKSMFFVYIFLNDTSRGRPHGFGIQLFDSKLTRNLNTILKNPNTFEGYKYAVQFLWYSLVGDNYQDSIVSEIHKSRSWTNFDKYFHQIQEQLIVPMEKRFNTQLGFDIQMSLSLNVPSNVFGRLIEEGPRVEEVTPSEQLSESLLWYDVKVMESSKQLFSGLPAFIPLVRGMVSIKQSLGHRYPVKVIRFVHPTQDPELQDFSYAILVGVGGSHGFSDYSGWLLFWDCCSNYGSSRELYSMAESDIHTYEKEQAIEVQEIEIPKEALSHYLEGKGD